MPKFNQDHFSELVQKALLGEEIIVTIKPKGRKPGTGKGTWLAPDFDESLDDFQDYM
jgi:hypothetical protein